MSELVKKLRNSIEDISLRKNYFKDSEDKWNRFCVSMDTLEDSDLAISHYLGAGLGIIEEERYLRLYGVLQAIYIQQNALENLWVILLEDKFPKRSEKSAWSIIKRLRNHTGHPIAVTRDKIRPNTTRRTFVNRVNLEREILSLVTYDETGITEHWGKSKRFCNGLFKGREHSFKNYRGGYSKKMAKP